MHGPVRHVAMDLPDSKVRAHRFAQALWRHRWFLAIVVLPTLIVTTYFYAFASDQYESGADFVVRRAETSAVAGGSGMSELLGFEFGSSSTLSEAYIVEEYLLSHDTVAQLRREDDLVKRFRRPGIDLISRLWFPNPTPEKLRSYYRDHVEITQDPDSGISHLRVHAFTPRDAYHIARKLLTLGEERINVINQRTFEDQVASARTDYQDAEAALLAAQGQLTRFRRAEEDIDPEGSGKAQVGLVTNLTGELVKARAQLRAVEAAIGRGSPQYQALQGQVAALEAQVAGQSDMIAGQGRSIASTLGNYEDLVIRREHATKRFQAAAAQYEEAKAEAKRQKLYLIRVVDTNMPVKSLFPEREKICLTIFVGLLLFYLIGRLLVMGFKEHYL